MTHFNKRHYEAIATVLQNANRACETDNQRRGVERVRNELADMFMGDNCLFDRNRFLHATIPGSNVKAKTAHLKACQLKTGAADSLELSDGSGRVDVHVLPDGTLAVRSAS
jgi:hypothetical protein